MTGVQTCALPICFPVTIPRGVVDGQVLSEFASEVSFPDVRCLRPDVELLLLELPGLLYILGKPRSNLESGVSIRVRVEIKGGPRKFGEGCAFDLLPSAVLLEFTFVGHHVTRVKFIDLIEGRVLITDERGKRRSLSLTSGRGRGTGFFLGCELQVRGGVKVRRCNEVTSFDYVSHNIGIIFRGLVVPMRISEFIQPFVSSFAIRLGQGKKTMEMVGAVLMFLAGDYRVVVGREGHETVKYDTRFSVTLRPS